MPNPSSIISFFIVHSQSAIMSTPFRNKKPSGEHHFSPFRTTNNVVQYGNNNPNQL
jgi:hypothetical protein